MFRSIGKKIIVLRNKMTLKNNESFKKVFPKSCKSHAERFIELNARPPLRQQLPTDRIDRSKLTDGYSSEMATKQNNIPENPQNNRRMKPALLSK